MNKFDFKDINLIPKKCIVDSRSECNTEINLGNFKFNLPIVPANMESIIDLQLCKNLAKNNYFYIMHRFNVDILSFIEEMNNENLCTSISIGVNDDSYDLLKSIITKNLKVDFITIDIAHGHSKKMENMIRFINNYLESFIIAGNVSTVEAVVDLDNWGANAIKCGIGPGSACSTYDVTGFGSRNMQASTIYECARVTKKTIICDGGIRNYGDITKAIVLGADIVMIGGMLSGFLDSPGEIIIENNLKYKEFWGSASSYNKTNRIEGIKSKNLLKSHTLLDEFNNIKEALQSSISYAGGNDLSSLKKINWI